MKTVLAFALLLWTAHAVASSPDYSYLLDDVGEVEVNLDADSIEKLSSLTWRRTVVLPTASYVDIHRVAIAGKENAKLRDALAQLPGITVVAEDAAQLVIEYEEWSDEGEKGWEAQVFRLRCQEGSAEPPCASRVYVRTQHDSMRGRITAGSTPEIGFADQLRQALITSMVPPPAAPNP